MALASRVSLTPLTKTSDEYAAVILRLSSAILREGHRDELNHLVGKTLIQDVCDTRSEEDRLKVKVKAFKIANPMLEHSFIREGSYSAAVGRGAISQLGHLPLPEAVGDAFVDTSSLYGYNSLDEVLAHGFHISNGSSLRFHTGALCLRDRNSSEDHLLHEGRAEILLCRVRAHNPVPASALAAAHFRNRARSRSRAKASKEEEQVLPYSSILRDEAGRNEKHGPGIFGSAVSSSSCFQIFRPCDVLPDYILRISWISEFHNSKRRRSSVRKNNHSFARNAEIVRTCIRDKIVKEIAQIANMQRALDAHVAEATDFCYDTARKGIGALQKETQRKMTLILGEELELRRRLQQLEWTEDFVNDCRAAAENDDKFLEGWAEEIAKLRDEFCDDQKDVVAKLHLRTGDDDDVDEDYGDDDVGLNMYFTGHCGMPIGGAAAGGGAAGGGSATREATALTALQGDRHGASHKERSAALAHAAYYWRGEDQARAKAFTESAEVISRAKRAVQF